MKGLPLIPLFLLITTLSSPCMHAAEKESSEDIRVRQILTLWKEGDQLSLIGEIDAFVAQYPESDYAETVSVMGADLLWEQKQYSKALSFYENVSKPSLKDKIFHNKIDCLFNLGEYETLAWTLFPYVSKGKGPLVGAEAQFRTFYYAETLKNLAATKEFQQEASLLYDQAKDHYTRILETPYAVQVKKGLAEASFALQDYPTASKLYCELTHHLPEKKEEMLYQAALAESHLCLQTALALFTKVQQYEGARESDAALNRAHLLIELGEYAQLIHEKHLFVTAVHPKEHPTLNALLGRAHFGMGHWSQTIDYLQGENRSASEDPSKLLLLIASHHQLNHLDEISFLSELFEDRFPESPALAQVWFLRAQTLQEHGKFQEALDYLTGVLKHYPHFSQSEQVAFAHAQILYKQRRWEPSREAFLDFVHNYPHSSYLPTAMQYIPNATAHLVQLAKRAQKPTYELLNQQLGDMQMVHNTAGILSEEEACQYLLGIGKLLHQLDRHEDALLVVEHFISEFPDHPDCTQAHLIAALSYRNGMDQTKPYITHMEKVLEKDPNISYSDHFRMQLAHTYLQLAKEEQAAKNTFLDRAADHLYTVFERKEMPLPKHYLAWLANDTYDAVQEGENLYTVDPLDAPQKLHNAHIAATLFEALLSQAPSTLLDCEQNLLKLSHLYGWLGRTDKQIALLENLAEEQAKTPEMEWTCAARTLFGLAYAHLQTGNKEKSQQLFQKVLHQPSSDSYVTSAAKLYNARLQFTGLAEQERTLEDPKVVSLLRDLKELQTHKVLTQEPLHLEAALDYAKIRASLAQEGNALEELYTLLNGTKQEFTDTVDQSYHSVRKTTPTQDKVYQAYMMLLTAHIARLESEMAARDGIVHERELKREVAQSLYKSLLDGEFSVTPYLQTEAKLGLNTASHSQ